MFESYIAAHEISLKDLEDMKEMFVTDLINAGSGRVNTKLPLDQLQAAEIKAMSDFVLRQYLVFQI